MHIYLDAVSGCFGALMAELFDYRQDHWSPELRKMCIRDSFHMPLVNGSYWAMVHGSNAEQVLQDAEGCAVMQELGRNMAWLLHCIQVGKAAGIEHPQNPKRPMTNFIR